MIQRIVDGNTFPPTIQYVLTVDSTRLMPALDILYIWSIRQMDARDIPIDADAFVVSPSVGKVCGGTQGHYGGQRLLAGYGAAERNKKIRTA